VVAAEGGGEGGRFEAAEVGFAVALEELGDGGSGAGLEVGVEVQEAPVEAGGEKAADGGLARSHEAGEDEAAEMRGDRLGAGLVDGLTLRGGFGLGFGLSGHGLSLQVFRENERAATFLGCGSGRSMTLRVLGIFRDACEDSTGRRVAPIGEGKDRKSERARHAGDKGTARGGDIARVTVILCCLQWRGGGDGGGGLFCAGAAGGVVVVAEGRHGMPEQWPSVKMWRHWKLGYFGL